MDHSNRPVLLTLKQMARWLCVKPDWLRGEALAGRVPCLPAGDTILFDRDLVERRLAKRARQTVTAGGGVHGD
jgi:hypothetical protein